MTLTETKVRDLPRAVVIQGLDKVGISTLSKWKKLEQDTFAIGDDGPD